MCRGLNLDVSEQTAPPCAQTENMPPAEDSDAGYSSGGVLVSSGEDQGMVRADVLEDEHGEWGSPPSDQHLPALCVRPDNTSTLLPCTTTYQGIQKLTARIFLHRKRVVVSCRVAGGGAMCQCGDGPGQEGLVCAEPVWHEQD